MIISINPFEAAIQQLSLTEAAVFDCMAQLIQDDRGAIFDSDGKRFKWLSASLIMSYLPCVHFGSSRSLNRIISKLVEIGLLQKASILGKPCYYVDPSNTLIYSKTNLSTQQTDMSTPKTVVSTPKTDMSIEQTEVSTPKTDMSTQRTEMSTQRTNMSNDRLTNHNTHNSNNVVDDKISCSTRPEEFEISDYVQRQGWEGFSVIKFMEYNDKKGWKCMPNWQRAAEDWHNQDLKFGNKPLTYNQLLNKINMRQATWSDYEINKHDKLWYPKRKKGTEPKPSAPNQRN